MLDPDRNERVDGARMRAILTVTAAMAFIALSYAAPDFQGYRLDQMPQAIADPPVQPVGFAFSIWGVIYLWLLISAGYGLLRRAESADWDRMRWPLAGSMVLGGAWLWIAGPSPVLAAVWIFVMLALALLALDRAPDREFWLARAPVGLFAGWLTAASFVSLGVVLGGFGIIESPRIAAWAMIVLAAIVAAAVTGVMRPGGAYPLAMGWALAGIALANFGRHVDVALLALVAAVGLGVLWWLTPRRA